ncbi:plasminogen activator inhibitor 2 [Thomomys bottae]
MEDLYVANTLFALNFFKHLLKTSPTQNLFFSPWSISSTMAMVYLGSKGNTEEQMAQVLQFNKVAGYNAGTPENFTGCDFMQQIQKGTYPDAILQAQARDKIHSSFQVLTSDINTSKGDYELESANKLFGEKSSRFKEDYMELCKKYYSTEPQVVDFQECAEEARQKINSWVKTQTKGKIPDLLPKGSVDDETKMVLVNAIYFKGKWKTPFEKKLNGLYPFRVSSTQNVPVQMMYLREKLNIGYIEDLKVQILELPYAGDVSMFLLLPDEIADASTGLELLEHEINYDKLSKWISSDTLAEDDVEVYLPQFRLEERYELKPILRSMGMEDAFSKGQANFSGMSEGRDLFLSDVFHQASVDVNEEGTVAAGGTGAVMSGRTGHGGPQFVADHPFLFFISKTTTKSILFWGKFSSFALQFLLEDTRRTELRSVFRENKYDQKMVNECPVEEQHRWWYRTLTCCYPLVSHSGVYTNTANKNRKHPGPIVLQEQLVDTPVNKPVAAFIALFIISLLIKRTICQENRYYLKLERKSVLTCKSELKGGAEKREGLCSSVKITQLQPQILTNGTSCQFCFSKEKQGFSPMESLASSISEFALEFSKKLAESAEGRNIFFSPWGIMTSLAMVYSGTKGNTAAQMAQVLQFNRGRDLKSGPESEKKRKMEFNSGKVENIQSDFQSLIAEILKPGNSYILKTANRIYGEKTYPFHSKYFEDMKTYFGAEPQSVNFMEAPGQIRKEINSWVASQTEGKIPDLLPDGSVDTLTRMVLVNALYFKGSWEQRFSMKDTTEKPFRVNETTSKPVQMMSMKEKLPVFHIEQPQATGLQLYYASRDLSLLILLPEEVGGLKQLEEAITREKLHEWTSEDWMELYEVQLHLPKFRLEQSYDLKSALSSLGMSDAFSQGKADFSGMSSERNLCLSNVFHKAFVEISEEGTEAAAGSGSEVKFRTRLPSLEFNADHPFLFLIRHNKSKSLLFYGRFSSP